MGPYQGVLPTPNAAVEVNKQVKGLMFTAIAIGVSGVFSSAILYFVLSQVETLDQRALIPIAVIDALIMIGLAFLFQKKSKKLSAVNEKVAGKEVLFFPTHAEFAATLFSHPDPRPAMASDHPYLKIQYRDIQSVRMLASAKATGAIEILMMNDNRITLSRAAFAEAEQKFFSALHTHKVSVPSLS